MRVTTILLMTALALAWIVPDAEAQVRIKDVAELQGARSNPLMGFGLVVGLPGTGGNIPFTQRAVTDLLQRYGIGAATVARLREDNVLQTGGVSFVAVRALLGPWSRRGSKVDVTVAALDGAKSLQGGILLQTPLKGPDGVNYVVAEGPVVVGGFFVSAPGGGGTGALATAQKNQPAVGNVPRGGYVEIEARGKIVCNGAIRLLLRHPDYTTASLMAKVINGKYPGTAVCNDPGSVQVYVPPIHNLNVVEFAAGIEQLLISTDIPAKVVIDARTGTIVAGENVKVATVAVAHGNLTIATTTDLIPSQPAPFSRGRTKVIPRSTIGVEEQGGAFGVINKTTTVGELAAAMRALGATPRDLISIFRLLEKAGALHAQLEFN